MSTCMVPLCTNTRKKSDCHFFRFPVDENLRKVWVSRIRRSKYEYNYNDRICSWHFPNGRKEDGPTRFAWNEKKDFDTNFQGRKQVLTPTMYLSPLKATPPSTSRTTISILKSQLFSAKQNLIDQKAETGQLQERFQTLLSEKQKIESEFQLQVRNVHALKKGLDDANKKIDEKENENNQLRQKLQNHAKLQCDLAESAAEQKKLRKINKKLEDHNKLLEAKYFCRTVCNKFDMEKVKTWNSKLLSCITGFQDYASFQLLLDIVVKHKVSYHGTSEVVKLSTAHQLLIVLMKLRLDVPQAFIGYLFGVSQKTISTIFTSLLEALYQVFYQENFGFLAKIPSRYNNMETMPKVFANMSNCRIVIDCTEFQMEEPSTLEQKKTVYSHYKSRYTAKVLVGCAPNGTVTFVSSLYGGSESDKSIVLRSKLLDQMQDGDLILADKGFQLFDILPSGVTLNIPSFLVNSQFTVNEIVTNNMYASARIIIERLNAKFKVFKILNVLKGNNRDKSEKIVKVCIALTTLMPTLMSEIHEPS